jgi:hypothetical protein
MKGKLINKNGKWFVQYVENDYVGDGRKGVYGNYIKYRETNLLPLHIDDVLQLDDAMLYPEGYVESNLVEFEIIEEGTGIYYGGLQPLDNVGGKGVKESTNQYAKLIQDKSVTHEVVKDAMKAVSKDVRLPKIVRDGLNQHKEKSFDEEEFACEEPNKVTRFEVIDHSENGVGRAYTKYNVKSLELSYQDDGRTLKIFIK